MGSLKNVKAPMTNIITGWAPKCLTIRMITRIDTYALKNKYITITPIHSDLTDEAFLDKVKTYDF